MTFEDYCKAIDASARTTMPQSTKDALQFESIDTSDGMARKQVARWTFNGHAVIFNAMSETGAFAGVEAASNPRSAPSMKVASIRSEGIEDGVRWIHWLTTEA
jgi:hypothetical protein